MKLFRLVPLLFAITGLTLLAPIDRAQSAGSTGAASALVGDSPSSATNPSQSSFSYSRPTKKTKLRNYLYDTFGPVPIGEVIIVAGGNQYENTPPEWGQGSGAYTQRVLSDFGIEAVTTTTRYALAEAFQEDTIYYRCECNDFLRRFKHAMLSTVMARHGEDGHWRFSFSTLAAPYAGNMTAVYAWYPSRYGAKDWLRMGTYNLLAFSGDSIFLEFVYGGPRTLFGHLLHRHNDSPPVPAPAPASAH
jgi:hypothetical protein